MLEIIASLIVSLTICYLGAAYNFSFLPSPFKCRHDKTIAHIKELESELWGTSITWPDPSAVIKPVQYTVIQPEPYKRILVERPKLNGRPDQQMPRTDTKGTA